MTTRAAIYARISRDDDDTGLGVARQIDDCAREAERRGWTVAEVYTDNDVSASGRKPRPEFDRLLAAVRARQIGAVVCWDPDRLSRSPRENETIIDLADSTGLQLANVGGEVDLSTPQGRMTFRIKGAVARHEIEQSSRRIKRKFDERAAEGLPHGMAAFGYRRIEGRDVIDPEQADLIRATARRLLAGESLRSIAADLTTKGRLSPRGLPWSSTSLRQVMLRDRNAGLRRHRGEVIGNAAWEAILSPETHLAVLALLRDPARRSAKGSTRVHLLSGLAVCGACGERSFRVSSGSTQARRYQCRSCLKVARKQEPVDDYIEAVTIARLGQPDAVEALASGSPERVGELRERIDGLEARLSEAADQFAEGAISGAQLRRISARLREQIDAGRLEITRVMPRPGIADIAGNDADQRWAEANIDMRRLIIDTLMVVTIKGVGAGHGRDPIEDGIDIEWKGADDA